jgi:two-component system, chemotaxis family, response regulator Rcp1
MADEDRGKPIDILLVEDNRGDVMFTREALAEAKVLNHLYVANDGIEALAFLRQEGAHREVPKPDLILLDLNLPLEDGWKVLEEARIHADLKHIPVIVLTTSQAEQDMSSLDRLHADFYISKPIDMLHFLHAVKSIEDFWISIVKLPPKGSHVEPVAVSKS